MQFQADVLGVPVLRPKVVETTALGAAFLAGLGMGYWKDRSQIENSWQMDRMFEPKKPKAEMAERRGRWREALSRAKDWEKGGERAPIRKTRAGKRRKN
jgi:glycerol kinase